MLVLTSHQATLHGPHPRLSFLPVWWAPSWGQREGGAGGLQRTPGRKSKAVFFLWHGCTMECYSAVKKNEVMPFTAAWMDLEILILSEVSQTEKDKHHMISLI